GAFAQLLQLLREALYFQGGLPPVELREFPEALEANVVQLQLPQALLAGPGLVPLPLRRLDAPQQAVLFLLQRGDFRFVAPTEDVAGPIADGVPIVLFVPGAPVFDLPGARDGPRLAAKLVQVVAAGVVETVL